MTASVFRERSVRSLLLWASALALLLLVFRLWQGLHYSAIFVSSGSGAVEGLDIRVYGWLPQRKFLQQFERLPEVPRVWMMAEHVEPITKVLAALPSGHPELATSLRVTAGDSWTGPVKVLMPSGGAGPCADSALVQALSDGGKFEVMELPVGRVSSILPGLRGRNWQGDGLLLLVAVCQSGFMLAFGLFVLQVLATAGAGPGGTFPSENTILQRMLLAGCRVFVLLLAAHQFVVVFGRILMIRSGVESLAASLLGILLMAGISCFVGRSRVWFGGRSAGALLVLVCVCLLLRVVWIQSVDSYQSTDYARYLTIGEQICEGRWDLIGARGEVLVAEYARRAMVVTVPAVWLFGKGLHAVEYWNLLLQAATLLTFGVFVRLLTGSPVRAVVAAVLLMLMPEFWYTATIATHNVPANFLLALCLLLLECIRRELTKRGRTTSGTVLLSVSLASMAGAAAGLLEVCRNTGLFLAVAVILSLGAYGLIHRAECLRDRRKILCSLFCVLAGVGSGALVVQSIGGVVAAQLPPAKVSSLGYLSAVDSAGTGIGRELEPWRTTYFPRVPADEQSVVGLRRLVHEKLAAGIQFWQFMFRKNAVFSWQGDALVQCFDRLPGLIRPMKHTRVPWYSLQQGVCDEFYLLMLTMLMARLLLPGVFPSVLGEAVLLLFAFIYGGVIYVLTEAHPYYSQGFFYPVCLSAALVLAPYGSVRCGISVRAFDVLKHLLQLVRVQGGTLAGASVLCVAIVVHAVVGGLIDRSAVLYCRIQATGVSGADAARVEQSRVHVAVALPDRARQVPIRVEVPIRLECAQGAGSRLKFFLTANQRVDRRLRIAPNVSEAAYEVLINGKVWRQGSLRDLNTPEFCTVDLDSWGGLIGDAVELRVVLSGRLAEVASDPEWLAIEYPYCQ